MISSNRDDDGDLDELASLVRSTEEKFSSRPTSNARAATRRNRETAAVDESRDSKTKDGRMWAVYGGKNFGACERAVEQMPAGQYTIDSSDAIGIFFHKEDINLDELMILPDSKSEQVIKEIKRFWTLEEKFREFKFLWKRGVMLWGPPGSGKTSTLQIISKDIVDLGGISIYVDDPTFGAAGLKILRQVEPKRPLVIMLEDIDSIIDNYGESGLLALMDGELQIDNVVFVATTNYPERLDKRFINRPSRFDIVKKIGMPSSAARTVYLKAKNKRLADPDKKAELAMWVNDTKGFSIAHLKELIISVEVFDQPLDASIKRLKKMGEVISSTQAAMRTAGFINTGDDPDE